MRAWWGMAMEVKWLSLDCCEWLAKRLGSSLIYVRLEVRKPQDNPVLRRSLILRGKHGTSRLVFAEEYGYEDARALLRVEGLMVERLRQALAQPPSSGRKTIGGWFSGGANLKGYSWGRRKNR